MFEPNQFETDTAHALLEELGLFELMVDRPSSVVPEEVRHLMTQPSPWLITEGPWPVSSRPENWAS